MRSPMCGRTCHQIRATKYATQCTRRPTYNKLSHHPYMQIRLHLHHASFTWWIELTHRICFLDTMHLHHVHTNTHICLPEFLHCTGRPSVTLASSGEGRIQRPKELKSRDFLLKIWRLLHHTFLRYWKRRVNSHDSSTQSKEVKGKDLSRACA